MTSIRLLSPVVTLLLLAACQPIDSEAPENSGDDEEQLESSIAPEAQEAALACKKPGTAACPLRARTNDEQCVWDIGEKRDKLLRDEGLDASRVDELGRTPDGGYYQYVEATHGWMGIYCHPSRTRATGMLVYGAIHDLWASNGYEAWIGYPIGYETSAGWCADQGATREQPFEPIRVHDQPGPENTHLYRVLCWSPERGAWLYEFGANTGWEPL